MSQKHQSIKEYCPHCKTDTHSYYDSHRDEVYCDKCGLILRDNTLVQVTREIERINYKSNYIKSLWKRRR